ncbi:WhiB family transcriptional regulator [Streptomyces rubrogriseus]|uniref:WhiB family transcriptional regulator n=1 Tax=Streptomyces rubrogriseus TaxID=194673 RepID=UPI0037A26E0A
MKTRTQPLLRVWDWQADAACRGMDSEVFFPPTGERGRARRQREDTALAVCRGCAVSGPCGSFAITSYQHYGVWGGYTETERRSEARKMKRGQLGGSRGNGS